MKKIAFAFIACVSLACSAFAGHEMKDFKDKGGPAPVPCFSAGELQLDLFGLYGWGTEGHEGDGWGGGLGVNYFITNMIGIGVDGTLRDNDNGSAIWNSSASLIVRFPIEGSICLAPYILAGGGVQTNSTTFGTFHAGAGIEWRATSNIGIFTEGRYIWAGSEDNVQARLGVRVVF